MLLESTSQHLKTDWVWFIYFCSQLLIKMPSFAFPNFLSDKNSTGSSDFLIVRSAQLQQLLSAAAPSITLTGIKANGREGGGRAVVSLQLKLVDHCQNVCCHRVCALPKPFHGIFNECGAAATQEERHHWATQAAKKQSALWQKKSLCRTEWCQH